MAATVTRASGLQGVSTLMSALARGLQFEFGTLAFDNSYPTGGEAVSFGFTPDVVVVAPMDGYVFAWDSANGKVLAYEAGADGAALDEVANETDLSAVTTHYIALGL
jgi:hypothetical protein